MNVNISLIKHWNSDSVLNPAFTAAAAHTHSGFYMDCRTNNNLRIGHQKTKVVSKQIQLRRRRVKRSHRRSPLIWSTTRLSPLWNCRSVWEEGRKEGGRRRGESLTERTTGRHRRTEHGELNSGAAAAAAAGAVVNCAVITEQVAAVERKQRFRREEKKEEVLTGTEELKTRRHCRGKWENRVPTVGETAFRRLGLMLAVSRCGFF